MEALSAIVYTSVAVEPSAAKIEYILYDAREYNQEHGLTGVLLYSKGAFLQYLEGPPDQVTAVYERIKNAKSHTQVKLLIISNISQRTFSTWKMGYAQVTASEMLTLYTAQWVACEKNLESDAPISPGISLLKTFWMASQA